VSTDGYMVYPVAEGDCRGLYVSSRGAQGFDVRELQGGVSNIGFTYRVVARRKDIEGRRLARVDGTVDANLAKMRAQSAAQGGGGSAAARGAEAPLVANPPVPPPPPMAAPRGSSGRGPAPIVPPVPFVPQTPQGGPSGGGGQGGPGAVR